MKKQKFKYDNRYGSVVLSQITPVMPISQIVFGVTVDNSMTMTFDTAEKVALITDNLRLQPVCPLLKKGLNKDKPVFYVKHITPDTGCVVKVDELNYHGGDTQMELKRNRVNVSMLY